MQERVYQPRGEISCNMGWLTKILKGSSSSHKISEGQYYGRYEDGVWTEPHTSAVISFLSVCKSLFAITFLYMVGLAIFPK